MNRMQLEHVLRASGNISGCREIVILGSQAILGPYPRAPVNLITEADINKVLGELKAEDAELVHARLSNSMNR